MPVHRIYNIGGQSCQLFEFSFHLFLAPLLQLNNTFFFSPAPSVAHLTCFVHSLLSYKGEAVGHVPLSISPSLPFAPTLSHLPCHVSPLWSMPLKCTILSHTCMMSTSQCTIPMPPELWQLPQWLKARSSTLLWSVAYCWQLSVTFIDTSRGSTNFLLWHPLPLLLLHITNFVWLPIYVPSSF